MCGTTARMALKTPLRLVPIISCQAWSDSSHSRPVETIPAFATRMSIRPNAAIAASATRATAAGSRTSAGTATAWPPAFSTSDTVSVRSSTVPSSYWTLPSGAGTSHSTMRAPSRASATASARPCPRAPPVISATWPSSSPLTRTSRGSSQPADEDGGQLVGGRDHRVVAGVDLDDLLHPAQVLDELALLARRQRLVLLGQPPGARYAVRQPGPVDGLQGQLGTLVDEDRQRERALLRCHPVGEHPLRHPQRQPAVPLARPGYRHADGRDQRVQDPLALGRHAAGDADDPADPLRSQPGRHAGDGQPEIGRA